MTGRESNGLDKIHLHVFVSVNKGLGSLNLQEYIISMANTALNRPGTVEMKTNSAVSDDEIASTSNIALLAKGIQVTTNNDDYTPVSVISQKIPNFITIT